MLSMILCWSGLVCITQSLGSMRSMDLTSLFPHSISSHDMHQAEGNHDVQWLWFGACFKVCLRGSLLQGRRTLSAACNGCLLGRQELFLSAHCNLDQQGVEHCLGLFLGMQGEESEPIALDYEFSVRLRPDNEFLSMYKGSHTLNNGIVVGCRNLCDISWTPFLNEDSMYFINGVLHIRAEISVIREWIICKLVKSDLFSSSSDFGCVYLSSFYKVPSMLQILWIPFLHTK